MTVTVTVSATADTPEAALALIKGTSAAPTASTLAAKIAATPSGGTLTLLGGVFKDTAPLPKPITLSGVGANTIIDCTGLRPTNDKAVLVVQAAGCTIADMTLQNASIPAALGLNAAGVRDNGPGIGFTLRRVAITGCQNGVLTFASNITLDTCNIHDNGAGNGLTHEVYADGTPTTTLTVTGSAISCGPLSSHALKSRAGTTIVTSSKLLGAPAAAGGNGGSVIDLPNGGLASITDTDITLSAGAANHTFLGFGMENNLNAATGSKVTLLGVRLHGNGIAGSIETKLSGATLVIGANCTYDGATPPQLVGWGSVTGTFTKAA